METFALITLFLLAFCGGWATHEMIGEFRGYYDPQELRESRAEAMRYATAAERYRAATKKLEESLEAYRETFGEMGSLEDRYAS
jgi:hypothetical protein